MKINGYILLHRKLLESSCWNNGQKYDIRLAWIYILLTVNYEDREQLYNGQIMIIRRGQKLTSMTKLANEWGVNRKTVKRWLDIWKSAEMIKYDATRMSTLITVVNFSKYQDFKSFNKQGVDNQWDNQWDNRRDKGMDNLWDNQWDTNKEIKESKELKEINKKRGARNSKRGPRQ